VSDKPSDHISDVRSILMAQLRALREATPDKLAEEIRRAKAVNETAQTIVNTARVEVDYIAAIKGAASAPFIEAVEEERPPRIPDKPQSPLPSADDPARLGGPSAKHPWRGNVTRHR
jgi:DNA helicase HerA-like ATPase